MKASTGRCTSSTSISAPPPAPTLKPTPPDEFCPPYLLTLSSSDEFFLTFQHGRVIAAGFDPVPGGADAEILLPKASSVIAPIIHCWLMRRSCFSDGISIGQGLSRNP